MGENYSCATQTEPKCKVYNDVITGHKAIVFLKQLRKKQVLRGIKLQVSVFCTKVNLYLLLLYDRIEHFGNFILYSRCRMH